MADPREPPGFYDDLNETLAEAWRLISRGVKDRRSGFHTPTVATIGLDGAPRARTVVLRGCDVLARILRFHTDVRAAKVAELARDPRIAMHFYDAQAKVQVRIEGMARVHGDDAVAHEAWQGSLAMSRVCYGVSPGPGQPIDAGDAFALPQDDAAIAAGRADFRAVLITAISLEWLYLARCGHRRARFDLVGGEAQWLAP